MATTRNMRHTYSPGTLQYNLNTGKTYKIGSRRTTEYETHDSYTEAAAMAAADAIDGVTSGSGYADITTAVAERIQDSARWIVRVTVERMYNPVEVT